MEFLENSIRICIDRLDEKHFEGRIIGVSVEKMLLFYSTSDFIVKVDQIFDTIGKPQAHQVIRSFQQPLERYKPYCGIPKRYHTTESIKKHSGSIKTLDMVLDTRKHTEWQGVIKDTEGELVGCFESTLEALGIIQ